MFHAQWRLSVITFISVPVTLVVCKVRSLFSPPVQFSSSGDLVRGIISSQPHIQTSCCSHPHISHAGFLVQVYGSYYRKLSKNVQEVLAEANVVAEEVLSTMTTVKAFAAEDAAESSYAERLQKFAHLQLKEAAAYSVYAFTTILMPNSVAVVALFYVTSQTLFPQVS